MNAESRLFLDRAQEDLGGCELLFEGELFSQAVSRAYHAMFHAAQALIAHEGLGHTSEAGLHAAFGQLLLKFGGVDPRFHSHILTAFRQRQAANYRPSADMSAARAREALAQAREFVGMVSSYLDEQSRDPGEHSP